MIFVSNLGHLSPKESLEVFFIKWDFPPFALSFLGGVVVKEEAWWCEWVKELVDGI